MILTLLLLAQTVDAKEFAARRADLLKRLDGATIVVPCEDLVGGEPGIDANTPLYDFDYLVGAREAGAILVISGAGTMLFADAVKPDGIDTLLPRDAFDGFVGKVVAEGDAVELRAFAGRNMKTSKAAQKTLEDAGAEIGKKAAAALTEMRLIKSDREREMMKAVTDQTNAAHVAAMKACKPGMNEKEIQKVIEDAFEEHGGTGLGFPSIVGSGMNGTILHYMANNKEIKNDVMIVMDIGSGYHGYSSDVTRTIPSDGDFNDDEREIYQCVLDAQKAAEKALKPGATWQELERAAQDVIKDRGLTKWSYAHAKDFSVRHGLGHYVGLSVHDSGSYREKMAPGMVITIEPGIYDKDKGIGVRIEDIYLVTEEGFIRLSEGAPREIDEIEKLMNE
ncbi:MAG: hypothetical protein A3F84_02280 [Candidatus Handelsmanbacteria bacterium RIFCSPLOWO2_12_FULL_64_10]|uniref:Xaa-Pro aminopeptidase n=1 Tax=Handelsmanbacteria sp. (strain RIFCSPLOWO2_12_FULL_64_10) TaxID=1817868 RepID=A0A1F6CLW3_HANXR|nr:MAG: hypothetical protein A3F84_02280 [Candidatus Handelsmanbacteria bacterium RIFCSPLOWO2_12_FULL_64_10]